MTPTSRRISRAPNRRPKERRRNELAIGPETVESGVSRLAHGRATVFL
jgi:hypothetical protein